MPDTASPGRAELPDLITYYARFRRTPAEVHPSGSPFVPELAQQSRFVLGTGCAAGGTGGSGTSSSRRPPTRPSTSPRRSAPEHAFLRGDLTAGGVPPFAARRRLKLTSQWDGKTATAYILLSLRDLARKLLEPHLAAARARTYDGRRESPA